MNHKTFSTGAMRSSDADGERWDLISPIGLRRVAQTCREGAEKYGEANWEKGMPINELMNHALRHVYIWLMGDRSEDHLAHAAWNLLSAMHSEEMWPDLNQEYTGMIATLRTNGRKDKRDDTRQESSPDVAGHRDNRTGPRQG